MHLTISHVERDGTIRLEVSNDGSPLPEGFDPKSNPSLGLQIVDSLARDDLGGRFTLVSDGMTRATIVFPR